MSGGYNYIRVTNLWGCSAWSKYVLNLLLVLSPIRTWSRNYLCSADIWVLSATDDVESRLLARRWGAGVQLAGDDNCCLLLAEDYCWLLLTVAYWRLFVYLLVVGVCLAAPPFTHEFWPCFCAFTPGGLLTAAFWCRISWPRWHIATKWTNTLTWRTLNLIKNGSVMLNW